MSIDNRNANQKAKTKKSLLKKVVTLIIRSALWNLFWKLIGWISEGG